MEAVQPIEGITPAMLWNFVYVLLAIAAVIILLDKVADVWRRHKARKAQPVGSIEDRLKKIEDSLMDINNKLTVDKRRLDALETQLDRTEEGFVVLCKSMDALIEHERTGNGDNKLTEAQKLIKDYTFRRLEDHRYEFN